MATNQKLTRAAIGKALHKHNKKRFASPPISKDEGMGYEALTNDAQDFEGLDDGTNNHDTETNPPTHS